MEDGKCGDRLSSGYSVTVVISTVMHIALVLRKHLKMITFAQSVSSCYTVITAAAVYCTRIHFKTMLESNSPTLGKEGNILFTSTYVPYSCVMLVMMK